MKLEKFLVTSDTGYQDQSVPNDHGLYNSREAAWDYIESEAAKSDETLVITMGRGGLPVAELGNRNFYIDSVTLNHSHR